MRRVAPLLLSAFVTACGSAEGSVEPLPDSELEAMPDVDDPSMPDTGVDETADAAGDAIATDATLDADAKTDATTDAKTDATDAVVDAPTPKTTCQAKLVELGISFTTTSARGVVDAVHITSPINGVLFASGTGTSMMGDPVACEFAKTLYSFAALLKSKGFVRVGTLGSYCYRCCCAWSTTNFCRGLTDPEPVCGTSGYSNHSWGRAIDVRYLYKADGTRYDINDPTHWVLWGTATETCTKGIAAQKGISLELYTLACAASSTKVFGTTLTPNYNSAHRNHLHMDIGESGTPTSWITRSLIDPLADVVDGCGDE